MSTKVKATVVAQEAQAEMSLMVEKANSIIVDSQESYDNAGMVLNEVRAKSKEVIKRKEEITKPLYAGYKSAMDLFKPSETLSKTIENIIKQKMLTFKKEQDRIAKEKAEKIQKRLDKGTMRPDTAIRKIEETPVVSNAQAKVKTSTIKRVRIVDWNLVPKSYFTLPSVLQAVELEIRKDVLGNKTQGIKPKDITGVEVYEEEILIL